MSMAMARFPISGPKLSPVAADYETEAALLRIEGQVAWGLGDKSHRWYVPARRFARVARMLRQAEAGRKEREEAA